MNAGYDNVFSLNGITDQEIDVIEDLVSRKPTEKLHDNLKKSSHYSDHIHGSFSFLPGHRKLIKVFGNKAGEYEKFLTTDQRNESYPPNSSIIMKEMIDNLRKNENKAPTSFRYSETLQWFATYVFMLSGKAAYEVLSNNLPLPQASTIRESTSKNLVSIKTIIPHII